DSVLLVSEVVDLTDQRSVLVIEASLSRPVLGVRMSEMPLADDGSVVTGVLESLRQQIFVGWQSPGVSRRNHQGLQAVAEGIAACHKRGARGRTHRLRVKLLELDACLREHVEVGSLDIGSVEADVFPAEVVGDDVDDIGLLVGSVTGLRTDCES